LSLRRQETSPPSCAAFGTPAPAERKAALPGLFPPPRACPPFPTGRFFRLLAENYFYRSDYIKTIFQLAKLSEPAAGNRILAAGGGGLRQNQKKEVFLR
jgi:hypothetical protein